MASISQACMNQGEHIKWGKHKLTTYSLRCPRVRGIGWEGTLKWNAEWCFSCNQSRRWEPTSQRTGLKRNEHLEALQRNYNTRLRSGVSKFDMGLLFIVCVFNVRMWEAKRGKQKILGWSSSHLTMCVYITMKGGATCMWTWISCDKIVFMQPILLGVSILKCD